MDRGKYRSSIRYAERVRDKEKEERGRRKLYVEDWQNCPETDTKKG